MATSESGRLVQSTRSIESGELVRSTHPLKPEALLKKINGQTRLSELEADIPFNTDQFDPVIMSLVREGRLKIVPVGESVNIQTAKTTD